MKSTCQLLTTTRHPPYKPLHYCSRTWGTRLLRGKRRVRQHRTCAGSFCLHRHTRSTSEARVKIVQGSNFDRFRTAVKASSLLSQQCSWIFARHQTSTNSNQNAAPRCLSRPF